MATMTDTKCQCCGLKMRARAADVARGWGKFCSKRCKAIRQTQQTGRGKPSECHDDTHPFSSDAFEH